MTNWKSGDRLAVSLALKITLSQESRHSNLHADLISFLGSASDAPAGGLITHYKRCLSHSEWGINKSCERLARPTILVRIVAGQAASRSGLQREHDAEYLPTDKGTKREFVEVQWVFHLFLL